MIATLALCCVLGALAPAAHAGKPGVTSPPAPTNPSGDGKLALRPAADLVNLADPFEQEVRQAFKYGFSADGLRVAGCVCQEWRTTSYTPCLQYNDKGDKCVKWGTPEVIRCCARWSCGESGC